MLLDRDHEVTPTGEVPAPGPDALIREAHRRSRRRRLRRLAGSVLIAAVGVLAYVLATHGGNGVVAGSGSTPFVNVKAFAGQGQLAFVSRNRLWLVDGDARSVRELPMPRRQESLSPEFSHDHRWLAYLTESTNPNDQNSYELWVARGDGTDAHEIRSVDSLVGWSPRSDTVAVTVGDQTKYPPFESATALDLISPGGHASVLVRAPLKPAISGGIDAISGAAWSPDGNELAVVLSGGSANTIETVSANSGRRAAVWFTDHGSERVRVAGLGGRVPTEVAPELAGWWSGRGIGFWVIDFGGSRNLDNTPLVVISNPGAEPRLVAQTLSTGITDEIAVGPNGKLAVVVSSSAAGRVFAMGKAVETCAATNSRCTPLPGATAWTGPDAQTCRPCLQSTSRRGAAGSGVSEDPSWSPNGLLLAYTKAASSGTPAWPADAWFADHAVYVWNAQSGVTKRIGTVDGAAVPTWSADSRDLLYESGDGLWLMSVVTGKTLRIEYPLYSQREWNTRASHLANISFYGQIPWTKQFSWNTP